MADEQKFRHATFAERVGDKFLVRQDSDETQRALELIDVVVFPRQELQAADAQDREAFSLLFHDGGGSADSYLPQGTYRLRHERLGDLVIFIVPVGPGDKRGGMRYEAIFT